ncbi:hypothetical protein Tco_0339656 [Tanacetum coccineum]
MDGGVYHSKIPVEKVYIENSIQEEESFNPLEIEDDLFSYESPACLLLEQCTRSCDNESIETIDLVDNMQELEVKPEDMVRGPNLERVISRWHVCKPVRVFYDNECGKVCEMWPTCNLDLSVYSGYDAIFGKGENGMLEQWMCFRDYERQSVDGNRMIFTDFLKVRYGNKTIDDTTRERRYYEWVAQNCEFNDNCISHEATMYENPCKYHHEYPHLYFPQKYKGMPKPWGSSLNEEYTKNITPMDKVGTSQNLTLRETTNSFHEKDLILNIKTYFHNFSQPRPRKPWPSDYSYKEWLRIKLGQTNFSKSVRNVNKKKVYALDDVWEKCKKFHGGTLYPWHDEGFKEEERWESDDALPLGRANGSRFMGMIRKEIDKKGGSHSKEMEIEVTSTSIHVVKRGYEFAQDLLVKSSALAIIIWSIEQRSGESFVLILLLSHEVSLPLKLK